VRNTTRTSAVRVALLSSNYLTHLHGKCLELNSSNCTTPQHLAKVFGNFEQLAHKSLGTHRKSAVRLQLLSKISFNIFKSAHALNAHAVQLL
jgi:hypothetical protein